MTVYKLIFETTGYWVGDDGSVWTVWAKHGGNRKVRLSKPRKLAPYPDGGGYLEVKIDRRNRKVHRLVLEAFVGPCPPRHECCHENGDPSNNSLSNIRWGTKLENWKDKIRHGRDNVGHNFGEANGRMKLTDLDVAELRRLSALGHGPTALSRRFGINRNHAAKIARGLKR